MAEEMTDIEIPLVTNKETQDVSVEICMRCSALQQLAKAWKEKCRTPDRDAQFARACRELAMVLNGFAGKLWPAP